MAKEMVFGKDSRERILKGITLLKDAVKMTLGPMGRNVILQKNYFGVPDVTKDGVTVARHVQSSDPIEQMGIDMMKQAAIKTDERAGDGTTTATVLTHALIEAGTKRIAEGADPMKLKREMDQGLARVIEELDKSAKKIKTKDIGMVAKISTNGDQELTDLIVEAVTHAGTRGGVGYEESGLYESSLKKVDGMDFPQGYVSPHFITNQENLTFDKGGVMVVVFDSPVNRIDALEEILASHGDRFILIIAPSYGIEIKRILSHNQKMDRLTVCPVIAPSYGEDQKEVLEDIAIIVGAELVVGENKQAFPDNLGMAERVIVSKTKTNIINGDSDEKALKDRIDNATTKLKQATTEHDKEFQKRRLSGLKGKAAIIRIGGDTESEVKEKMYRVEDALNATAAAIEEGIVPGGGVALMDVRDMLSQTSNPGGVEMLRECLEAPFISIMENAGLVPNAKGRKAGIGINALNGEVINMMDAEIVDPVKVTKMAIKSAVSVAGMILTTECVIADIPEGVAPLSTTVTM